ncbi:MAG TPA: UDP-N-acetylglucosamine--N-acetylmuramyl-(pentapeptide) pyrophosphoryl-undecaprenol N-acetylglucosamine transferase, partial [Candidatus Glassbacteria bacterium]|nr:UDP-N-acetylglucosamine--N-acetylmuramyl-(pentapeptide) pyrophosphoryl-undecaprenol N-acetylglucosamine transferase [Candidatus Glassbacteria bacterium]
MIPALVLAREFCARHPEGEVLFVGTRRGAETRLVPQAGFPVEFLEVGALQGQSAGARRKTITQLPRAVWKSGQIL